MECQYETLAGWKQSLDGIRSFNDLPAAARTYVETIERLLERPVTWISTSPAREDTFRR